MNPELPDNRILTQCSSVILGGNTAAMVCALREAERSRSVLLITSSTFLYEELFSAGDIRPPRVSDPAWQSLLFPPEAVQEGFLHPDRLKRHGEQLLEDRGVRILYACQTIGWADGTAVIAAKSGFYSIRYTHLFDCRAFPADQPDSFILHTMHEGRLHITVLPAAHTGSSAAERYLRYRQALEQIPVGHTLARSGTEAGCSAGVDMDAEISFGLHRSPEEETSASDPPSAESCDILVIGGGTAGASA